MIVQKIVVEMLTTNGQLQSRREVMAGTTPADIASQNELTVPEDIVCARCNGELVDLSRPLNRPSQLEWVTADSPDGLAVLRHSTAHVLAQAVLRLRPEVQLAMGPAIQDGFYYDIAVHQPFSGEDLQSIEKEMWAIVAEDLVIHREEMTLAAAQKLFEEHQALYKLALLEDMASRGEHTVTLYRQGEFFDLCRGPHIMRTGVIKAFRILHSAGAYWRGESDQPMLQRIYGAAFGTQTELDQHLERVAEAARRDHRKVGAELDLFSIQAEGPGLPFFHPKGMVIRNELERFWREIHQEGGYQEVKTPILLRQDLWHTSGHMQYFKDNMYFTNIDAGGYVLKPMNCPGGMLLYRRKTQSYRDLPLRMGELGLVHRHELSGTLHGLMRARCFTQDDAHIFMTRAQVESEIAGVIQLIDKAYGTIFGFSYHIELSTKPEKAMGDDATWELATAALKKALADAGMSYQVNPGDGAFYGPKIDFHLRDCLERTWQCGTVQLDFLLPERFNLHYIDEDGERQRPIMLHRVLFGSLERFIAILTEHFAGAFPTWLAPVQAVVVPINDDLNPYGQRVADELRAAGIRVDLDGRSEKVGYKIRQAQIQQIPYMLVVGEREQSAGTVSVRHRRRHEGTQSLLEFSQRIQNEIAERSLQG